MTHENCSNDFLRTNTKITIAVLQQNSDYERCLQKAQRAASFELC